MKAPLQAPLGQLEHEIRWMLANCLRDRKAGSILPPTLSAHALVTLRKDFTGQDTNEWIMVLALLLL
jgi:hypothetical protein